MFDDDRPEDRLLRASIPGRPTGVWRSPRVSIDDIWAPGRPALEVSVLLSAVAMVVPVAGLGACAFAWQARRRGNGRATLALVAACWCILLGVVLRLALGLAVVP